MIPVFLLGQIKEQPALDAFRPKRDPLREYFTNSHYAGRSRDQNVEIAGGRIFKRGHLIQFLHEFVGIDAFFQFDRNAETAHIGKVSDVVYLPKFGRFDKIHDLVYYRLDRRRIRDLVDLDRVPFFLIVVFCANLERTDARVIYTAQLFRVVDEIAARRKIGSDQSRHQIGVRVFDQRDRRVADLPEVERTDRTCHSDRNTLIGIDENVRKRCRKQNRLRQFSVIVRHEINNVFFNIGKNVLADIVEFCLRVSRRGVSRISGIMVAEVSL